MKFCIATGTRPELIRMSLIIKRMKEIYGKDCIFVYSNQNFEPTLSTIFFKEMELPNPDYVLLKEKSNSLGEQIGKMMEEFQKVLVKEKIERVIFLGDTNTCLAVALISERLNIPCWHIEGGNRCLNPFSPEEKNRKAIDHVSTINMTYLENSKQNLINEGVQTNRIFIVGNPIVEVIEQNCNGRMINIAKEKIFKQLFNKNFESYFLVTLHRAENVDNEEKLKEIVITLDELTKIYPDKKIVISTHPRTKDKLNKFEIDIENNKQLIFSEPFGFIDFKALEQKAELILTDSGLVQEEASIMKIPCVIIREATERIETIENGDAILAGTKKEKIIECVKIALEMKMNDKQVYTGNTVQRVINVFQGNYI